MNTRILGLLKIISVPVSDVNDNIEKTRKKAGMFFWSSFDRHKVNPLTVFIRFSAPGRLPKSEVLRGALSKTSRKIETNFSFTHQN